MTSSFLSPPSTFSHYSTLFIIFCVVLFFYLHIQHQFQTSNDLEVYDLSTEAQQGHGISKERLEEVLELRQPTLFASTVDPELHYLQQTMVPSIWNQHYATFEVKIRDLTDDLQQDVQLHVPLQFHLSQKLFTDDTQSRFLSENNHEFLSETGLMKTFQYNDEFLRPPLLAQCWHDVWLGSSYAETPLRYFINCRNMFMVTHGVVRVKLIPPQYTKYMHAKKDYDNFEFRSPISAWYPQPSYQTDFYKTKAVELTLTAGQVLSIPPYWWHSFQLEPAACIAVFYYRTYMNVVAILPELCMSALQRQNVKNKYMRTLPLHSANPAPPATAASSSPIQMPVSAAHLASHTTSFGADNPFAGYAAGNTGGISGTIDKTPFSLFSPPLPEPVAAPAAATGSEQEPTTTPAPAPAPTLSTGLFGEHPAVAGMLVGRPEPAHPPQSVMGDIHVPVSTVDGVDDTKYAAISSID